MSELANAAWKKAEERIKQLTSELNAEQLAHEEIGTLCAEVGGASHNGTSVSAVRDTIQIVKRLESALAEARAQYAELHRDSMEMLGDAKASTAAMLEKAAKETEAFEYYISTLTQFGETKVQTNPYADVHKVAAAIRALITADQSAALADRVKEILKDIMKEHATLLDSAVWHRQHAFDLENQLNGVADRDLSIRRQEQRPMSQCGGSCNHPYACRSGTAGVALICIACRDEADRIKEAQRKMLRDILAASEMMANPVGLAKVVEAHLAALQPAQESQ